jgi:hypothetical protein
VTVPLALAWALPLAGALVMTRLPGLSVAGAVALSLVRTLMTLAVLSAVTVISAVAVGRRVMVSVTVAVLLVSLPSVTW